MCGRSSLTKTEKELEERFNATFYSDGLVNYNPLPNYNVAPSHVMPVITNEDRAHFQAYRWGLIPSWAKDQKIGYKMINARIVLMVFMNGKRYGAQMEKLQSKLTEFRRRTEKSLLWQDSGTDGKLQMGKPCFLLLSSHSPLMN